MVSVRLAVVLGLYALLVAAALITITVVFSVLSKHAMNEQVLRLASAAMSTIRQATVDEIISYQVGAYRIMMALSRLDLFAPRGSTGLDINDYVTSWEVMSIPASSEDSTFLNTFEMWLDETNNQWYVTGCSRQTELCSLHDAATNTTQVVKYNSTSPSGSIVDLSSATTIEGTPPLYNRYLAGIALQKEYYPSWWNYLYIDHASSVTTHTCNGVAVAKTIDYFYCTAYTETGDASNPKKCTHLVGVTVEASNAGALPTNRFTSASTLYLSSPRTVDNVGGICDTSSDIRNAMNTFLKSCTAELYGDCSTYMDMGKTYVYTVLGYSQTNGVGFVIGDRAPRSFFFETIDHSQEVAIAISVVMIVLVVVFSVIISISIIIPINYICKSMKNASNLTYERKMPPLTKYTIFSEVKQLCASYLDLRQALKDLKAFMPQGLLIGPDEALDSASILSALMGGGRYHSEGDEDGEYSELNDADAGANSSGSSGRDEDGVYDMGGRGGGFSEPDTNTSVDTTLLATEMTQRRSSVHPPTLVPPPDDEMVAVGVNDDSPLPGHRRSVNYGENFRTPQNVVSVVPVNATDEAMARNAAVAAAKTKHRKSNAAAAVPAAGESPKRRPSSHVKLPATTTTNDGGSEAQQQQQQNDKSRAGYSLINSESSRNEGASLRLNRSVYNGDVNKFRNVNATLVCFRISFQFIDEHSLTGEVSQLMNILIRIILRFGGVIEVFRPDVIIVSFGAHAAVSQHTQRAVGAAMTIMKRLTVEQRARTRIAVDTGAFYCGTCGANGRISPVLFGDRFDAAVELIRYDLGLGRLIVTDRVALCLPSDFVVPFDYLMTLRDRSHGTQLFLVVNPAKRHRKDFRESVGAFRRAYALASGGQYAQAVEAVARGSHVDAELAGYCATTFKFLMTMNPPRPRYCRFQLPGFEPLGVVVKEKVPKYQHDRLHLNEIEPEEEEHISINFGFGGGSSSITTGNVQDNNRSQSRVFMESSGPNVLTGTTTNMREATQMNPNQSGSHHLHNNNNPHANNNNSSISVFSSGSGGSPTAGQRFRNRAASRDDTTQQRSFQVTDDYVGSTSDQVAVNASQNSMQLNRRRDVNSNMSHAGDTGRTDCSDDGLPLIFADHKGEKWHRFPTMIGSGAFAEVYKAISENGSLMALKCIHLAATNVQLADVVSEVNTACKLFSDFIVNHVGWAHVGSYMVIIMDYMPGGSLHTALSAFPTGLTLQVAKRYASDALRGLAYLHRSGVVHADFKPQNILLATDGGCRLSDFGSSVTKANARTSGGDVFHLRGTPAYMSPEVARGDSPSMKSDMWSFGVTLYEMLTGRLPWVMRKGGALPAVPGGSFLGVGNGVVAGSSAAALTVENALVSVVSEGYNSKVGVPQQAGVQKDHGTPRADGSYIASGSGAAAPLGAPQHNVQNGAASLSLAEWVPLQGLSDVRVVQGIANGSVRVHVEQAALPTLEAYQLIISCLQETPQGRPISWEVIDHSFFFS